AAALAESRSPRKKLIRARHRNRRRTVTRAVVALALAWWTSGIGSHPGVEGSEIFLGGVTALAGVGTVVAGARWYRLPLPPPPTAPRPGGRPMGSAARPPLERLANRERALAELLALLGPSGEDVSAEAAQAAVTLRDYAARLRAVEVARDGVDAA